MSTHNLAVRHTIQQFFTICRRDGIQAAISRTIGFIGVQIKGFKSILMLLYLSKKDTVEREFYGSKMELDPSSSSAMEQKLALGKKHEKESSDKFVEFLEQIETKCEKDIYVFDVGANIGYYPLIEASILGDSANIYAIEPDPSNIEKLSKNLDLNEYDNIDILQAGLGSKISQTNLDIQKNSNNNVVSDINKGNNTKETIKVDIYPLDELVEEYDLPPESPIVIRMDIEGYEKFALQGMKDILSTDRPIYMFLEIHDIVEDCREYVIDALNKNCFSLEYVSYDGGSSVIPDNEFQNIMEVDQNTHIFVKKDSDN